MEAKNYLLVFLIFAVSFGEGYKRNRVSISTPSKEKCINRPRDFTIRGRGYFYSGNFPETDGRRVGWEEAKNMCREYCMDTISIETQAEFDMVVKVFEEFLVDFIWTSGHVCDYAECLSNTRFQPTNINGWYWTGEGSQLPATNSVASGWNLIPWSQTGFKKLAQPDNAEFDINRKNESCLAVLHNVYDDGIKFHDVACYHKKPFICQDSEPLLKQVGLA